MTFDEYHARVAEAAANAPQLGKSIKLKLDEGTIHIDLTGEQAVVTKEDKEADTTVVSTIDSLEKMRKGELNPMMAMMTQKVKIEGDMGLAMKLQSLLG